MNHYLTQLAGRQFLGLSEKDSVYAVLEDDGTEVDEEVIIDYNSSIIILIFEEYFQLLPESQILMILSGEQNWTPNFSLPGYRK